MTIIDYVAEIKKIMVDKRLNETQLANEIGISQQRVSLFLLGKTKNPSDEIVRYVTKNIVDNEKKAFIKKGGEPLSKIEELIRIVIKNQAAINILISEVQVLSSVQQQRSASLVSGELRQAIKTEEDRLLTEYDQKSP